MRGEHDIRGLLEFATADEPPPGAGPASVFRRARSIQRRRRLGVGLAGAAMLGVLLLAGVSLAGVGQSSERDEVSVPAPAAPGPTATTEGEHPRVPVAAAAVLETLRSLLPPGTRTSGAVAEQGFARLVITDAGGRTTLEVNVQPDFAASAGKATGASLLDRYDCAKRADPVGTRCAAASLLDETRVVSLEGAGGEPGAKGVTRRQVDILAPDGVRIVVTAWNAVDLKNGPATRPAPALDTRQLKEIAISSRWRAAPHGGTAPDGGARNE
ncbi:hypothetical protein GA0070624_0653 [Micromonospora rhizosphaerae]|uniref:Uncharacterized protein n=1 Tax=Micromonospora rhizosphaerae TaxID=568872 RepID=A0A1C6RDT0_9ACTN|nr:hypothetical protein [Micromonospora rhizosphaerae]SCL15213.1 hypothetical protein GA0070624_0653 [Micromonospora rhizosphaerae]